MACEPQPAKVPTPAEPGTTGRAKREQSTRTLRLPTRPAGARSGSSFVDEALGMRPAERELRIVEEVLSGNVPDFERPLHAIELEATTPAGVLRGRVHVMRDYLAIGVDDDFVRVPMTIRSARSIAKKLGCVLPTTRIVDLVHVAAPLKIGSPYMPPGRDMASTEYLYAHHQVIEERRKASGQPLGALLSGPKKDLVISKRMLETSRRTAIYGWFKDDGSPIQTLSLVHDDRYVDYAHGIRLVDGEMEVSGASRSVLEVLADRDAAAVVSDEGTFDLRQVWARGW